MLQKKNQRTQNTKFLLKWKITIYQKHFGNQKFI